MIFQKEKTPCQAVKTRSPKSRKNGHFSKGDNPCRWSKNGHFSNLFFQLIQARKISFTIFQNDKNAILSYKTGSSKSRKIHIFPNCLIHGFGPKMTIFPSLFFQAILARKMSFVIFQKEKTPSHPVKPRSSKVEKMAIFPKRVNPWFWSKNDHFSKISFQAI